MSKQAEAILVTSHVSRDFEQNAAYFSSVEKVVWEYVSNSLDAAKDDKLITVYVQVKPNSITAKDNGRGMSRAELASFFQMHGENTHRKRGKATRGRFGTGKSAAFGLAKLLTIDTVQNGKRNVVSLSRSDIKAAADGRPFPVQDKLIDDPTNLQDGTKISVTDFLTKKRPKAEKVIRYVERHLGRFKGRAQVFINDIQCEYKEPPHRKLPARRPPPYVAEHIGNVELVIKISGAPLLEELQGIDILSKGILHETTRVGIENKEHTRYIFGEVDAPLLEEGDWDIPAFDNTRNLQLNDQNPFVARLRGWISHELKQVHEELIKEAEAKRQTEQAKKLRKEAKRLADVLNEDFSEQEMKHENARRATDQAGVKPVEDAAGDDGLLPGDGEIPTNTQQAGNKHGDGNGGEEAGEGETPRPGPSLIDGDDKGRKTGHKEGSRRRRRAVFSIEYENASAEEARSRYDGDLKTIYINLDHLQIGRALQSSKGKTDGPQFREMCYEVAAVEYSLALEHERVNNEEVNHADDALYNMRDTINRITRRIADVLYK